MNRLFPSFEQFSTSFDVFVFYTSFLIILLLGFLLIFKTFKKIFLLPLIKTPTIKFKPSPISPEIIEDYITYSEYCQNISDFTNHISELNQILKSNKIKSINEYTI